MNIFTSNLSSKSFFRIHSLTDNHFPTFRVTTPGKQNDFREYLREIAAKIKTIPWRKSRTYGDTYEKIKVQKSHATVPLRHLE